MPHIPAAPAASRPSTTRGAAAKLMCGRTPSCGRMTPPSRPSRAARPDAPRPRRRSGAPSPSTRGAVEAEMKASAGPLKAIPADLCAVGARREEPARRLQRCTPYISGVLLPSDASTAWGVSHARERGATRDAQNPRRARTRAPRRPTPGSQKRKTRVKKSTASRLYREQNRP